MTATAPVQPNTGRFPAQNIQPRGVQLLARQMALPLHVRLLQPCNYHVNVSEMAPFWRTLRYGGRLILSSNPNTGSKYSDDIAAVRADDPSGTILV